MDQSIWVAGAGRRMSVDCPLFTLAEVSYSLGALKGGKTVIVCNDLFISYHEKDAEDVAELSRSLEDEGFSPYYFEGANDVGATIAAIVAEKIRETSAMIVLVSHWTCENPTWVLREVTAALELKKPVLPLLAGVNPSLPGCPALSLLFGPIKCQVLTGQWPFDCQTLVEGLSKFQVRPKYRNPSPPVGAETTFEAATRGTLDEFDIKWLDYVIVKAGEQEPRGGQGVPRPKVYSVLAIRDHLLAEAGRNDGGDHAERTLLDGFDNPIAPEATLYTNLEPCSRRTRGPSCTDAIITSGVQRVVIAQPDTNAEMLGRGVQTLLRNNVQTILGPLRTFQRADQTNNAYHDFFQKSFLNQRRKVVIAIPAFHDMPFFSELLRSLLFKLETKKLDGVVALPPRDADAQTTFLESLTQRPSDFQAMIVFPVPPTGLLTGTLRKLPRIRKPLVFLDLDPFPARQYPDRTYFVASEDGGAVAATYAIGVLADLVALDRKPQILVICSSTIQTGRQTSFAAKLEEVAQHRYDVTIRQQGDMSRTNAYEVAKTLLDAARYDFVYATNDDMAIGVLDAVDSLAADASKPIGVLGFDGVREMRERMKLSDSTSIATIVQDVDSLADQAVAAIMYELDGSGEAPGARTLVPVELGSPVNLGVVT